MNAKSTLLACIKLTHILINSAISYLCWCNNLRLLIDFRKPLKSLQIYDVWKSVITFMNDNAYIFMKKVCTSKPKLLLSKCHGLVEIIRRRNALAPLGHCKKKHDKLQKWNEYIMYQLKCISY